MPRLRAVRAALVTLSLLILATPGRAPAQTDADLLTRAERTGYVETSRYQDVMAMSEALAASDLVHLATMGYTFEGRAIPLLVVGRVDGAGASAVRGSGLLRVYLQGNIHAGEVPGKEALQMLVRSIAQGEHAAWLDRMVLLVAPIYNADGNERVALTNRPRQHGPIGGMGQRANAQGFDLNRDHMKLDSPEARSLVALMNAYDPHVVIDLHTTNGTRHGYHLTYSPPLHPGTHDGIVDLLRGAWLPSARDAVRSASGYETYYYGNVPRSGEAGWFTFDHRPRFNNNYVGLRNRFAVLGEAYSYATFEERVDATLRFVEALLDYAAPNAERIARVAEQADRASVVGVSLPTRATLERSEEQVEILLGDVVEERNPYSGRIMLRRLDRVTPTTMWEYGTFAGTETEVAPVSYYVPPDLEIAVERLSAHGVRAVPLDDPVTLAVEVFDIDSVRVSPREFQGHNEVSVSGHWRAAERTLPAGTLRVDVAQPLGRLAFYLLEPRSDDGLVAWGLLNDALEAESFPVLRARR